MSTTTEAEKIDQPTALSVARNAINQAVNWADESQALMGVKIKALLVGYDQHWDGTPYVPVAIEQIVPAPLINPATKRKSRTFINAGKLDVICKFKTESLIIDHKTTSDDIEDPESGYRQTLVVEGQVNQYMLLEWINGRKVDFAVWDMMRKPGIAPKKLAKAERARIVADGDYFGFKVPDEMRMRFSGGTLDKETLPMYGARLEHDCTVERPKRYFARHTVYRLDQELHDYATDLWAWGKEMLHARGMDHHPTTSTACMAYGRPCTYLGICQGHDTPDSDTWKPRERVHTELPELEGDGRNVMTISRIKTFQLCRRKHYFRYELGIERQVQEDRPALVFGTLWHVGVAAWWQFLLDKEKDNGNRNRS